MADVAVAAEPTPLAGHRFTQNYAKQPELYAYARFIADKYNLYDRILADTPVSSAVFDAEQQQWLVSTERGDAVTARFVILANGPLTEPKFPTDIAGMDGFAGHTFHTARWNESFDLSGKRVGVIGTGTSAVQTVPRVAEVAEHLTVFQRTPIYCTPKADGAVDPEWHHKLKYEDGWMDKVRDDYWNNADLAYHDVHDPVKNEAMSADLRQLVAEIVEDPDTAAALTPDYP